VTNLEEPGVYGSERDDRQHLHELEVRVTDIATAVEASLDLCSLLRSKHSELEAQSKADSSLGNLKAAQILLAGLFETERELKHYRRQADLMHLKIRNAAKLVWSTVLTSIWKLMSYQLTNILDLDNGHALRILGLEARQENLAMQKLTQKSAKDAEAVKVLTIVTLVYLPTTAVLVSLYDQSVLSPTPN
jgi:hypothetical protein